MKVASMVRWSAPALIVLLVGCQAVEKLTKSESSEAKPEAKTAAVPEQPLYLCCNIRTESDWLSDGGYVTGRIMAAGTPVKLVETRRGVAYVEIDGRRFRLSNEFGNKFETLDVWLKKVLVPQDPTKAIASYPQSIQSMVKSGKITKGMTKQQVIVALGYPPAHANSSLDVTDWTYMHNRWGGRYIVQFDQAGRVRDVNAIGGVRETVFQP
jgi:hypothetical protein